MFVNMLKTAWRSLLDEGLETDSGGNFKCLLLNRPAQIRSITNHVH